MHFLHREPVGYEYGWRLPICVNQPNNGVFLSGRFLESSTTVRLLACRLFGSKGTTPGIE